MSSTSINKFSSFGNALNKALKLKRLSNREFADILGVHESQVSNWINERTIPYKRTQRKITSALGVSILESDGYWHLSDLDHSQESDLPGQPLPDQQEIFLRKILIEGDELQTDVDDLPLMVKLMRKLQSEIDKHLK